MKKTVIIESPFANKDTVKRNENILYVNAVARNISIITKGKLNPLFFHTFYTQFLCDDNSYERDLGLEMSFVYHDLADLKLITIDRGISGGMVEGVKTALLNGKEIQFFTLCEPSSEYAKAVEDINQISDPKTRWEAGLAYVSSLEEINPLGDLTTFRKDSVKLYKAVAENISNFFNPLGNYAQNVAA
ncbi:hypothetical protein [Vibrio owensii]|uniref:DUF7768 domain-containing protein n=1 Tax=Vibrio harveyi group TaxID=717610 RepID=UPI003CC537D0